jgi:hypothetical protein
MKSIFDRNISASEKARRYLIGSALIAVVMVSPSFPAWVALFACYPIFTAMVEWDPANLVIQRLINKLKKYRRPLSLDRVKTA